MRSLFTADFFTGNRQRLRGLFPGTSPIIITANGQLQRSADITYPFRQDSNFWYLTGIDEPDLVLVIDKEKEYLILPERDEITAMFDGVFDHKAMAKRSGIKQIYSQKDGWPVLERRLKKVKHAATLAASPVFVKRHNFYTNPSRQNLINKITDINGELRVLDLREHFLRMRVVKQPQELAAIQRAIDITVSAIAKISKKLDRFSYEYEIEAQLTYEFAKRGAHGHSFEPVIAAQGNTAQLHYRSKNQALGKGPVLLDVGAEVENYAADITRTYPIGKFNKRQQAIFDAVLEAQDYAINILKPGVKLDSYERQVRHFVGEKLRELGLIKSISPENVRKYFPSLTSHFLGLDVHDIGNYEQVLEPGMVLTVEPGIYVAKEGMGVRIEDDVLITEDGVKVLSQKLPRKL